MSPKVLEKMVETISKSYPVKQARQEAVWITQELPQKEWLNASHLRSKLVPLQYILGSQPFGKLDISCKKGVLIPRLDTEEWVLEASDILRDVKIDHIVDYCTGSGCIGLGFASELRNTTQIECIDFKDEAVDLARKNHELNSSNIQTQIKFHKGSVFDQYLPSDANYLDERSHNMLVSNPPYIPEEDLISPEVEESVLRYEPRDALLGDSEFYEALCSEILIKNKSFKGFIFELGYMRQAQTVAKLLDRKLWNVGIRNDKSGKLRNVLGWKSNSPFTVLENMVHHYL